MLKKIEKAINQLNEMIAFLSSILVWVLVAIMVTLVVMRYLLGIGSVALQESVIYIHAFILLMGAGYTLRRDAHVRVDVLYRFFDLRKKAWVNCFGAIFLLMPFTFSLLYFSWEYVAVAWSKKEASAEAGGLPYLYLLKSLLVMFPCLLLLSGVAQTLSCVKVIVAQKNAK